MPQRSERPEAKPLSPGQPLPGLSAAELERFRAGRAAFEATRSLGDGLGPLYNELACNRCHNRGGVGGAGFQVLTLVGQHGSDGYDALLAQGGPLVASSSVTVERAAAARLLPRCTLSPEGESVPERANVFARRRTTPLFGLGLVEATPDATFEAIAAAQPAAIRGRVARPPALAGGAPGVGRFGWKAQFSTLLEFSAVAFRNELGITSPLVPDEQAPGGDPARLEGCDLTPDPEDDGASVRASADFMRWLAPVAPAEPAPHLAAAVRAGDRAFSRIGCDGCHVRTLTSGEHESPALSRRRYHPYSDFLLHDMGPRADGIGSDGDAGPREMRTAPLWGLRLQSAERLLHDGRARSLRDAVVQHEGQAAAARDAFLASSQREQDELLAFLATL